MTVNQSIAARKRVNDRNAKHKAVVMAAKSITHKTGKRIWSQQIEPYINEFLTALAEQVPIELRVSNLEYLLTQREHLPTSLNTEVYIAKLQGMTTEKAEEKPQSAPLFALPAGTTMRLDITTAPSPGPLPIVVDALPDVK